MLRERRFPLAFYGGGLVCEVDCKVSDWLTCISQRTKRTGVLPAWARKRRNWY